MQSLLHIGERIENRVIERHAETITRFLDILDARVDNLKDEWNKCSYAVFQSTYVDNKLLVHTLKKRTYMDITADEYVRLADRIDATYNNINFIRLDMYKNVCGECPWCKTRRKSWPVGTVIKDANLITVKGGMKLVLKLIKPTEFTVHKINTGDCDGKTSYQS